MASSAANNKRIFISGSYVESTVTNRADEVTQWLADNVAKDPTYKRKVVGLNVEWNRTSKAGNRAATLQLCIEKKCLIVQLTHMDYIPPSLKRALISIDNMFVGMDKAHVMMLKEYGLYCDRYFELKDLFKIKFPRLSDDQIEGILVADLNMEKPDERVIMSNWEARSLGVKQIRHATVNVFASFEVGKKLH